MRIDIGTNDKGDEIEEMYPGLLREESLSEGKSDRRHYPRHAHDRPESGAHGGTDLVESLRACNDRHGSEVEGVLDGRYLRLDLVL